GVFGYGGRSGEAMYLIGVVVLVLMPICVGVLVWRVPERNQFVPARMAIVPGLRIMWANAPFRRLVFAFVCSTLAVALTAPLFVLFVSHVVGDPTAGPKVVFAYFIANMLGVLFWVWLAERTDKHVSWLASLGIMAAVFPCFMLLE